MRSTAGPRTRLQRAIATAAALFALVGVTTNSAAPAGGEQSFSAPTDDGSPFGSVWLSHNSTRVWLSGQAWDRDSYTSPIEIHVYSDDVGVAITTTSGSMAGPNPGGWYSFFDLPVGIHTVCSYAINLPGTPGDNILLGCDLVPVPTPGSPTGNVSGNQSGALVWLGGNVLDPDLPQFPGGPIDVHVFIDGAGAGGTTTTNGAWWVMRFDLPTGDHSLCAYGINVPGTPGENWLLGCRAITVRHDANGALDFVFATAGGVWLAGWAWDWDAGPPTDVHVYVDGEGAAIATASVPREDNRGGFSMFAPTEWGWHEACAYAINQPGTPGDNLLLGCQWVFVPSDTWPPTSDPIGNVDPPTFAVPLLGPAPGQTSWLVTVRGWVLDLDTSDPIDVRLRDNGAEVVVASAGGSRPDIARQYPFAGDRHGFTLSFLTGEGTHNLCVDAFNALGTPGSDAAIVCTDLVLRNVPFGRVDRYDPATGRVHGWAIDPKTGASIDVDLYLHELRGFSAIGDPVSGARITATQLRPDVGAAFPTYGAAHGFDAPVTLPNPLTTYYLCAYGIDSISPAANTLIGCVPTGSIAMP